MYPSLRSREIEDLSRRYGMKVWQSYLENNKSGARRMYWVYEADRSHRPEAYRPARRWWSKR
jgi:hypothetical protein